MVKEEKRRTERKERKGSSNIIYILGIIATISIIFMAVALTNNKEIVEFEQPEFDINAIQGIPEVDEELGWAPISADELTFSAHVCGEVNIVDSKAQIYFTNDSTSKSLLRLKILDTEGKELASTGLIRPGEYIESIEFKVIPKSGTTIEMKIMSHDPDTYYSDGSVYLETTVK